MAKLLKFILQVLVVALTCTAYYFTSFSYRVKLQQEKFDQQALLAEKEAYKPEINTTVPEKIKNLTFDNLLNSDNPIESQEKSPEIYFPIANFESNATFKHYGTFITPETSPVQPERFRGFHTGVDIEILEADQQKEIPVMAIADGTVKTAGRVNGYGGVITISHTINGTEYTALYGHLNANSLRFKSGDQVKAGDTLGILGKGFTSETDNERMHLHFGILKGSTIDFKGYVQSEAELNKWIDPEKFLKDLNL